MEPFIAAFVLAVLIEGTITYILGESSNNATAPWMRYIALTLGVVTAWAYNLDLLAVLGLVSVNPLIGYVTTGLIIGRGSNYVNDFISRIRG